MVKVHMNNDLVAQQVAKLQTDIGLLTKIFIAMGIEKVNVVGTQVFTSKIFEIKLKEEAKYHDRRLVDL